MQRISVNLTNDCDLNKLNCNNDLPAIGNNNYVDIIDSNQQHKTQTIIRHLLSSPRQPNML